MPDQFSRGKVYIVSKAERKYDILQKQNCVIIKRKATPAVFPDYIKPRPISHVKKKKVEEQKAISIVNKPVEVESVQTPIVTPAKEVSNDVSLVSPISNSMSFEELQKKVEKLREQESNKEPAIVIPDEDETPIITMEDADDLANGVIAEEQELINKEYLKSLKPDVLKKVYYVATGKRWNKDISKFEMRKDILSTYKNSNSKRKQIIYESSREAV